MRIASLQEGAENKEPQNGLPLEGGGAVFAAGDTATEGVEKQLPQSRHRQSAECLASSPEEEPEMRIASRQEEPEMGRVKYGNFVRKGGIK